MSAQPLVSCLCVTRGRAGLLARAIRSFTEQDYPEKELLIIYEDDDPETGEYLQNVNDGNIEIIKAPASPKMTLGALRNMAVRESRGEYFCQWDDDDYSHPGRVSFQMEVIAKTGMGACIMFHVLMWDALTGSAYVSARRPWEGTLLAKKSLLANDPGYDDLPRGEDTSVVSRLFSGGGVFPVFMPKLYVYAYHGGNVWTKQHWGSLFDASSKLSGESSALIRGVLEGEYTGRAAAAALDGISE